MEKLEPDPFLKTWNWAFIEANKTNFFGRWESDFKYKQTFILKGMFLFQVYLNSVSSINTHGKLFKLSKAY